MDGPNIVFEDKYLLVLDKPSGLIVNKAESVSQKTLQDILSTYFKLEDDNLGIGNRTGIVHRLDKETSGLLLIAKAQQTFENLQEQFAKRLVLKQYLALCHGRLDEGQILAKLARNPKKIGKFTIADSGRESETKYQKIGYFRLPDLEIKRITQQLTAKNLDYYRQFSFLTFLRLYPTTGRTHQLRVHLQSLKRPIVSDKLYLNKRLYQFDLKWCPRLFLHAAKITFKHPATDRMLTFDLDLPNDLKTALNKLKEV